MVKKEKTRDLVANEFGTTGESVGRYLMLLKMLPPFQSLLIDGKLTQKACYQIGLLDKELQSKILDSIDCSNVNELGLLTEKSVRKIKKYFKNKSCSRVEIL